MQRFLINKSSGIISQLTDILDLSDICTFLAQHQIGLLITLGHYKALDWPWKGKPLNNDPVELVPMIWAIMTQQDANTLSILFDLHPTKCFPKLYNTSNPNSKKSVMPVIENSPRCTLAGCPRNFVTMSNRRYEIHQKTPDYCTIFGLPDDCYSPDFQNRMLKNLMNFKDFHLWSFERTPFLSEKIDPYIPILYMKGEFLPSLHFMYTDSPHHFLKGIFPSKYLQILDLEPWYSTGKELLENMNLNDCSTCFRSYLPTGPPLANHTKQAEIKKQLGLLRQSMKAAEEDYISQLLEKIKESIHYNSLKKSRFMVMDVEYVHVSYPIVNGCRTFNFPCIFSTIAWLGPRDGFLVENNIFLLPCHFCNAICKFFKNHSIDYNCLTHGFSFIDRQASLIESLLLRYEGLKIYTYGRSDVFQLEQAETFFTDSFDINTYKRRNRKRAQRIVNISQDLSVPETSLQEIEENILKNWLCGWSRRASKVEVNSRFTTHFNSSRWATRYHEAIQSCTDDAISALLYLLNQKFKVNAQINLQNK